MEVYSSLRQEMLVGNSRGRAWKKRCWVFEKSIADVFSHVLNGSLNMEKLTILIEARNLVV